MSGTFEKQKKKWKAKETNRLMRSSCVKKAFYRTNIKKIIRKLTYIQVVLLNEKTNKRCEHVAMAVAKIKKWCEHVAMNVAKSKKRCLQITVYSKKDMTPVDKIRRHRYKHVNRNSLTCNRDVLLEFLWIWPLNSFQSNKSQSVKSNK